MFNEIPKKSNRVSFSLLTFPLLSVPLAAPVGTSGSHSLIGDAAKVAGIASVPAIAKSTKKKTHLDDDLFENETENETAQQSPGMGALPAFLAVGMLLLARRKRMV